jgi:hypothetical protein
MSYCRQVAYYHRIVQNCSLSQQAVLIESQLDWH